LDYFLFTNLASYLLFILYLLFIIYYYCNHIIIGSLYILAGAIGGSVGVGLSLLLRCEIMIIGYVITSAQQYTSVISFHGLFMIFFFIMPILIGGFGNILLPIMLGSSDLIFPRLNACSI